MSQFHHSSFKQAPTPRIHINLPKINIKSFEGDPLEWLTFWDSFSAAIDKNLELSDVEKMNYLIILLQMKKTMSRVPVHSSGKEGKKATNEIILKNNNYQF